MMPDAALASADSICVPADLSNRRMVASDQDPAVLADVYKENVNLAIWERKLSTEVIANALAILSTPYGFERSLTVSPQAAEQSVAESLPLPAEALAEDIADVVDMFCCLFELERVGLRLAILDRAMCPRFHVDNVPCRLLTTYQGPATQWLPHDCVDRSKLGRGSNGLSDQQSGLFKREQDIRQMQCGDVALLKGELWEGNEQAGVVHRSPAVKQGCYRLVLTLDMFDQ